MRKAALFFSIVFGLGFGIGQLTTISDVGMHPSNDLIFSTILIGLGRGYAVFAGIGVLVKHLYKNILEISSDEEVATVVVGAAATIAMAILF